MKYESRSRIACRSPEIRRDGPCERHHIALERSRSPAGNVYSTTALSQGRSASGSLASHVNHAYEASYRLCKNSGETVEVGDRSCARAQGPPRRNAYRRPSTLDRREITLVGITDRTREIERGRPDRASQKWAERIAISLANAVVAVVPPPHSGNRTTLVPPHDSNRMKI